MKIVVNVAHLNLDQPLYNTTIYVMRVLLDQINHSLSQTALQDRGFAPFFHWLESCNSQSTQFEMTNDGYTLKKYRKRNISIVT